MRHTIALLTALSISLGAFAQAIPKASALQVPAPERTVSGNTVSSSADPKGSITVNANATYVGALRFVLVGTADCEIHLFVAADAAKRVRRIFWVQFEGYLPEHPTLKYTHHPAYKPVTMSGLPFYQRARFGGAEDVPAPGSEAERVFALLREKGYTVPAETVNVTYKHFLGTAMRKEILLMVIDDMASTGATFADFVQGNSVTPRRAQVAEKLLANASTVFTVTLAKE
jgi:hypothetical protein